MCARNIDRFFFLVNLRTVTGKIKEINTVHGPYPLPLRCDFAFRNRKKIIEALEYRKKLKKAHF